METRHCKIYLHDLDLKQQAKSRKLLISAAADLAPAIRFVQDLNSADLWLLAKDSSFIPYALKRQAADGIALCLLQEDHLFDENHKLLDSIDTYRLITQSLQGNITSQQKQSTVNIANLIHQGMANKTGKLGIAYKEALFLFDFSALQVKYNSAAYQMLWSDARSADLNDLVLMPNINTQELKKSCSAFSVIWLMTHRMHDSNIHKLFNKTSVLKLNTWPPFEQVKHNFDDYRIASLLQKKPLSIDQICQLLHLQRLDVSMFFHAIYLSASGVISIDNNAANPLKTVNTHGLSGLWRKVRNVVGIN